MDRREEYLTFALLLAREAERVILPLYRVASTQWKLDGTEVTEADRRAEHVMRDLIGRRYPSHGILGEEMGGSTKRLCWVLDPVDGTAWFSAQAPLFGTLIALLEDGEPVVGVMHFPALRETLYAAKGLGCYFAVGGRRPRPVRVAPPVPLAQATVFASGAHGSELLPGPEEPVAHLQGIVRRARKFKFYGDSVQHALVCRGAIHAAIDTVMHPWDIAAIVPCIEEAGGAVSSLSGERANVVFANTLLSACSPILLREVSEMAGARELAKSSAGTA